MQTSSEIRKRLKQDQIQEYKDMLTLVSVRLNSLIKLHLQFELAASVHDLNTDHLLDDIDYGTLVRLAESINNHIAYDLS